MNLRYEEIRTIFDIDNNEINTIVIENPHFFTSFITNINNQLQGVDGKIELFEPDKTIDFAKNVELLDKFIPFDLNKKTILSKISNELESTALNSENYESTLRIITDLERFFNALAFESDADIVFSKLSIGSLIKAVSPEIRDEYDSLVEKIVDYFNLVRTYEKDKLFITVNLRSYLTDDEMEMFAKTVLLKQIKLVMIETNDKKRFNKEKRLIIDNDLCEIS